MEDAPQTGRYLDGKLAWGLARQEGRALTSAQRAAHSEISEMIAPLHEILSKGGKIPGQMIRRFALKSRDITDIDSAFLKREISHSFKPVFPDRATAHIEFLMVAEGDPDEYNLEGSRIHIASGMVAGSFRRGPIVMVRHLAQRLMERRRSEMTTKAVSIAAAEMARHAGLVGLAARAAHALPQRRFALPFGEGLVLGEMITAPSEGDHIGFGADNQVGWRDIPGRISFEMMPETEDEIFGPGDSLIFMAKTFIGAREIRPDQKALRDKLIEIEARHAPVVANISDKLLWSDTPGFTPRQDSDAYMTGLREKLAAHKAVEDLLAVPGYAKALGNSGPAMPGLRRSMTASLEDMFVAHAKERGGAVEPDGFEAIFGKRPPKAAPRFNLSF